jgi:hypothetical protein
MEKNLYQIVHLTTKIAPPFVSNSVFPILNTHFSIIHHHHHHHHNKFLVLSSTTNSPITSSLPFLLLLLFSFLFVFVQFVSVLGQEEEQDYWQ